MPIYEYACHKCRMIYKFYSQRISTDKKPTCPKCGDEDLEKLMSSFAALTSTKSKNQEGAPGADEMGGDGGPMDDPFENMTPQQQAYAEREMMKLMGAAESMDENDPRQMGHFMEKMMNIVGQGDNKEVKEAIRRLKAGEDPEKIEEEMGDVLGLGMGDEEDGDPYGGGMGGYGYDGGLYDM
ncbi:MAG: FmdB family zinc ribbon protein [Candidatus Sumerlaeia bacterium]